MSKSSKTENKNLKSNPGSKFRKVYIKQFDDKGFPVLKVKEVINQFDEIQSYKEDNNIYKILARVGGDISKLDFNKGVYIDVSSIPDNYNDFMNLNNSIRSDFNMLPVEYKQALNNNFNIYYGLAMQGKAKDILDKIKKGIDIKKDINSVDFNFNKDKPVVESVVKEDK